MTITCTSNGRKISGFRVKYISVFYYNKVPGQKIAASDAIRSRQQIDLHTGIGIDVKGVGFKTKRLFGLLDFMV